MTTIITPKAQKTDNGLLNAYKSKEEVQKLYLDSEAIDKKKQSINYPNQLDGDY